MISFWIVQITREKRTNWLGLGGNVLLMRWMVTDRK